MSAGVYLDYNAGAPLRPEARRAALDALEAGGNPSSVHSSGRRARALVEEARRSVAELLDADPQEVIFTSGGAEANTLAILGAPGRGPILASALEHPTVAAAAAASGRPVETIPVTPDGVVDLAWLAGRLARSCESGPPLVAVMAASNETGAIQPIAEVCDLARAAGARTHVDAIAAAGRLPLRWAALGADTLSVSAHKLGGLAGTGALVLAEGSDLSPQVHGGGQERGLRGGTENLAGIAAFGAAARACAAEMTSPPPPAAAAAEAAARALKAAGGVIVAEAAPRAPQVITVAFADYPAYLQVMALDLEGIMVSAGAACSSGKVTPSKALQAMGLGALAGTAIRATGGWATTPADWSRFADTLARAVQRRPAHKSIEEFV